MTKPFKGTSFKRFRQFFKLTYCTKNKISCTSKILFKADFVIKTLHVRNNTVK